MFANEDKVEGEITCASKMNSSSLGLFSNNKITDNTCVLYLSNSGQSYHTSILIEYLEQSTHKILKIDLLPGTHTPILPFGHSDTFISIINYEKGDYPELLNLFENKNFIFYLINKEQKDQLIKDVRNDISAHTILYNSFRQDPGNNLHNCNSWIVHKLKNIQINVELYNKSFGYMFPDFTIAESRYSRSETKNLIKAIIMNKNSPFFECVYINGRNLVNVEMHIVASWIGYFNGFESLKSITINNCQIDCKAICDFIKTISDNSSVGIENLSLSFCNIDDALLENYLVPLFSNALNKLKQLKLDGNKITYTGARRIAAALSNNLNLELLDLSGNLIACEENLLKKLTKDFLKCKTLRTLTIDQNFLDKSCKAKFQKTQLSIENPLYCYSIYQTKAASILSILSPDKQITSDNWVVALACKKDTEHAMIYMEGMRKWGQRFLERYHINADGIIGSANALIESPNLKFFNSEDHHITIHAISKVNGRILYDLVNADKGRHIGFSKFYPSSLQDKVNCVSWCLSKLREVDIHIDERLFGLPSRTAKGSICAVM